MRRKSHGGKWESVRGQPRGPTGGLLRVRMRARQQQQQQPLQQSAAGRGHTGMGMGMGMDGDWGENYWGIALSLR